MPLTQRVPKLRGFYNRFRVEYQVVNCAKLKRFDQGSTVDPDSLRRAGLIRYAERPIKLLAAGGEELPSLIVRVHKASRAAGAAVAAAGGSLELIGAGPAEPPVAPPEGASEAQS